MALGFLLYFIVRGSVVDRAAEALGRARAIAELQAAVGLWVEPRLQAWALESDLLMRAMNLVYFWLDFPLIVGVLVGPYSSIYVASSTALWFFRGKKPHTHK